MILYQYPTKIYSKLFGLLLFDFDLCGSVLLFVLLTKLVITILGTNFQTQKKKKIKNKGDQIESKYYYYRRQMLWTIKFKTNIFAVIQQIKFWITMSNTNESHNN